MNEKLKNNFESLIAAINANPARAEVVATAQTRLVSGVSCEAHIREFPAMSIDEPPGLGGADSGPNPVELVLAALGTCQEIMYAATAALLGMKLDAVKVDVRGYLNLKGLLGLDGGAPAGFSEVKFETRIESPESSEKIQTLIRAVESHCPVMDMLTRPVPVKGKVWLNDERIRT